MGGGGAYNTPSVSRRRAERQESTQGTWFERSAFQKVPPVHGKEQPTHQQVLGAVSKLESTLI